MQGSRADPGHLEIRPGLRAGPGPGTGALRHGGFALPGVRLSQQCRHTQPHGAARQSAAACLGDNLLHAEEREAFGFMG